MLRTTNVWPGSGITCTNSTSRYLRITRSFAAIPNPARAFDGEDALTMHCFVQANPAHSAAAIKARLYSPNASEEVTGTLMLDGFNLSGHLSGGGIDVLVSGIVKNSSVQVDVVGHLLVSCGLNRQSMSGTAPNAGPSTSVEMTFTCDKRFMGGDYLFRLDLGLPAHQLQFPAGSDPGESAVINPTSGKVQRNSA